MIFDHPDRLPGGGQSKHQFDEIASGGGESARPKDAGGPDDQGAVEVGLGV